tara:strand:+ start:1740 stop:2099 length:360 start_codon:yes stop_codon:yes gene_type:complete
MKKLLILLLFISCSDTIYIERPIQEVPETLFMSQAIGLKLESYIVQDKVRINTKLPQDGKYRIKILDFSNKIINQEIITGKEGDNILNIYVNSLPVSSYTVELYTNTNNFIGRQTFSIN